MHGPHRTQQSTPCTAQIYLFHKGSFVNSPLRILVGLFSKTELGAEERAGGTDYSLPH